MVMHAYEMDADGPGPCCGAWRGSGDACQVDADGPGPGCVGPWCGAGLGVGGFLCFVVSG